MEEYSVSDYGIFNDAISTTKSFNDKLNTIQSQANDCKTKLNNESVFMGPICDSCVKGFGTVDLAITSLVSNFGVISGYLADTGTAYVNGDTEAMTKVLSIDSSGKVAAGINSSAIITSNGSTQATSLSDLGNKANNGDKAAQKEWLDKMSTLIDPYCKKYGFPKSVLLSQIIQESGWTKSGSWLNQNNNILNVNSEMFGTKNDYVQAKDGTRNENASIPKWASNPKHASGPVSGGAYFESPRNDSMRAYDSVEDCVEDYLALMVGYRPYLNGSDVNTCIDGVKGYAEDANYASNLHHAIDKYNLTQYDV